MMRLRDLEGELTSINYGDGVVLPCVRFVCPVCASGHSHVIPYGTVSERVQIAGRPVLVWKHDGGDTIDTITLSPSYLVRTLDPDTGEPWAGGCNIHGYVRDGAWCPC